MEDRETATQLDDPSEIDDRLRPLLTADGERHELLLQEVIEKDVRPLIQKIIGAKLHVSSTEGHDSAGRDVLEDLCQEAVFKLIEHLRRFCRQPDEYAVKSLDDFVAKIAFNAYNKYLRQKYPLRHRLKRQIYYLLNNRAELSLWKEGLRWISGLAVWRGRRPAQRHSPMLDGLMLEDSVFAASRLGGQALSTVSLDRLLVQLFHWLTHPLEFNLLVDTVADLLKIKDQPYTDDFEEEKDKQIASSAGKQPVLLTRLEFQEVLKQTWQEIMILREKQRWALLCHLRDEQGEGLIVMFASCGIATPQQIAETLGISLEELKGLWSSFPLRDSAIAARLGVTVQQVINLRKSARERLARRVMKLQDWF